MKRGGSLSFLVGTISNVLVMEIGWTDVGSGGYILVSCARSNTSFNNFHSHKSFSKIKAKLTNYQKASLFDQMSFNLNIS